MTPVGEPVNAAEHRHDRTQARSACNQEHDKDLVFDRLGRRHAAEDLPGHHAPQRNHASCRHGINGWHQRAAERLARYRSRGDLSRGAVLERRIGGYQRARLLLAGHMTSSMTFASELVYASGYFTSISATSRT